MSEQTVRALARSAQRIEAISQAVKLATEAMGEIHAYVVWKVEEDLARAEQILKGGKKDPTAD